MQHNDKADRLPQSRRKRDSDQSFLPETPQNERAGTFKRFRCFKSCGSYLE